MYSIDHKQGIWNGSKIEKIIHMPDLLNGSFIEVVLLLAICIGSVFPSDRKLKAFDHLNTEHWNFKKGNRSKHLQQDKSLPPDFCDISNLENLQSPSADVLQRIMNYARFGKRP